MGIPAGIGNDLGIAQVAAAFLEVIAFAAVFGWFAQLFIIVVSNKADADPTGSRPMAAYLFSGAFLTLWVSFIGVDVAANSLIQLIGSHAASFDAPSYKNDAIRSCVLGGLLLVFAGGAYLLHLRRGSSLAEQETDRSGPTRKIMRSFVALVSYVSMTITVIAFAVAGWLVAGLISPSIFLANASRTTTARALLEVVVIIVLAGAIFLYHQSMAPGALRLLSGARLHGASMHDHEPPAPAAPAAPSVPGVPPPTS